MSLRTFASMTILLLCTTQPALASKKTCHLDWELLTTPKAHWRFDLGKTAKIRIDKQTGVLVEAAIDDRSKVRIVQIYKGNSKNHISYEMTCGNSGDCTGSRETRSTTGTEHEAFTISGNGSGVSGSIGNRIVFRYRPFEGGFQYDYIAYEDPDTHKPMGLELTCHE